MLTRKILHIVNPNGFGHLKRASIIYKNIPWYNKNTTLIVDSTHGMYLESFGFPDDLAVEIWDLRGAITLKNVARVDFVEHYSSLQDKLYNLFIERSHINLIVTDNILFDCSLTSCSVVVLGSFLWHESINILNRQVELSERHLSLQKNLLFVGVEDIVYYNREIRKFRGIGWMLERSICRCSKRRAVLFSGGFIEDVVSNFTTKILHLKRYFESLNYEMYSTNILIDIFHDMKYHDISKDTLSVYEFVIGRPGVGLLTDAIESKSFIVAVGEVENNEMVNNARFIDEKGIGIDLVSFETTNFEAKFNLLNYCAFEALNTNGITDLKQLFNEQFDFS